MNSMTEAEFQVVKSIGFVLALGLAVAIQHWRPHDPHQGSWRTNGGLWGLNAVILGLLCVGCACTVSRWAATNDAGALHLTEAALWIAIPVSILGLDLVSYGWHRANHRVSLLWRFHQVHHSDPAFTTTTALRFHPGELLLALPLRLTAIVALGVPIVGVIAFEVVFAFANFFEHGNIGLPLGLERALGRTFILPALHRRHHSQEKPLLNSNYGTIFSFWDRFFGTYADATSNDRVHIGLPGTRESLGPLGVLAMPARGVFRGK